MRWLLRHRVGGWECFNMQLNLLMASLYNVVIVTISVYTDISPLNIHHNPVFNNKWLYLCFPSEHLLSKPHRAREWTEFTAVAQLLLSHFSSPSQVPLCLSPLDISLAPWHSTSQFSQYFFHPVPAPLERGVSAFCWLIFLQYSSPSHAKFREKCTCKWVGQGPSWFYLAGPHGRHILLSVYHIIL